MAERASAAPAQPSPSELLRAALEKIVFFEWRLSELAAELSSAQSRCSSAELERSRAAELARAAAQQAQEARLQLAELESERARLASLLARPAHPAPAVDLQALEAERDRAARLAAELADARRELEMQKAERARWLNEMIAQAQSGDDAPAALAQFISELRGEVIALRERQRQCDALLAGAGLAPPPPADIEQPAALPQREPEPVETARRLWAEGRLSSPQPEHAAPLDRTPPPASRAMQTNPIDREEERREGFFSNPPPLPVKIPSPPSALRAPAASSAARALADQCVRALSSRDAGRREQAARHLAAVPLASAAPLLAQALGDEHDARARAQLARALAACGGDGAAQVVSRLQDSAEPALVRLAALEALCLLGGERALTALEAAGRDSSAAVRRRAAALASGLPGAELVFASLAADADASVRAACEVAEAAPEPQAAPEPPARDVAAEAVLAVQAAIFGLTEDELAGSLGVQQADAADLAARLVAAGRLGRRGLRLVAAQGA